jgi:mannan endo-1,4-beta-mannosidase
MTPVLCTATWKPRTRTDHSQEDQDTLVKWQCNIAGAIKSNLQGRTDILVSTGGASYLATSAPDAYFSCDALDVIAIHAYGIGDLNKDELLPYVKKAQNAGKKLIMQEWGMVSGKNRIQEDI